jgi:hypothetical protein
VERELTLATLTLSACGPALLAAGALLPGARRERGVFMASAADVERLSARRVWVPAFAALVVFALALGWGLQEPDMTSEVLGPVMCALAGGFALVWSRALLRAAGSLLAARHLHPIAARTVGIVRPRVVISPTLSAQLDASELHAVMAHERAHVRHRDPLRIVLAQLVTDLQWPSPAARRHLVAWRSALELARDEEARDGGVDGADLASAILKAARVALTERRTAAEAPLVDAPLLAERIARLLEPREQASARPSARWLPPVLIAAVAAAVVAGQMFGEPIVQALP